MFRRSASGRKTWLWIRQLEGKPLREKLGRFPTTTIADAQYLASDLNRAIDQGRDPTIIKAAPEPLQEPDRVTVKEAWRLYIEDCDERGCKSVGKRDKGGQLDIVAKIGTKFVREVTPNDVRRVKNGPIERAKAGDAPAGRTGDRCVPSGRPASRACRIGQDIQVRHRS